MIYRAIDEELRARRRDALLGARRLEAEALLAGPAASVEVFRRRWTRCAFGLAAIAMAAVLVEAALTGSAPLTPLLDGSWFVAGLVLLIARPAARAALRLELDARFTPTGDTAGDVLALEGLTAEQAVAIAADRLEQRSVALPLAGLALLLPLTLHRLVSLLLGLLGIWFPGVGFGPAPMDAWIRAGMILTGQCHVLLALLGWLFARELRRHPDLPEEPLALRAGWGAFAWTSLASIPTATMCLALWPLDGWVAFMLVPTLVTLTGLAFIPAMFRLFGRAIARERAEIG